ncbi:MAG: YcxB family protein [Candidatus Melainabacteria bacterium]|nr:YcxB family protein [Candidatus Melainabacteria bacterium]
MCHRFSLPSNKPVIEMENIVFYVKYKVEEVNQGYWEVYRRLALPRQLVAVYFFAFAVSFGFVILRSGLLNLETGAIVDEGRLVLSLFLACLGIPSLAAGLVGMALYSVVMNSFSDRPNFHFPVVYILSEQGVSISFASGQGTMEWNNLIACVETGRYFCLAASATDVFVLPKRCLTSDADVEKVRHFLVSKVRTYLRHSGIDPVINYESARILAVEIDGIVHDGAAASNDQVEPEKDKEAVGLAVQVIYQAGEVKEAERLFFFRKRMPVLALFYLSAIGIFFPMAFVLSQIWGVEHLAYEIFENYGWLFLAMLPVFFMHALWLYAGTQARAAECEVNQEPFVFELSEQGCGVRAQEHFAMLAWWHFEEGWETKEALMLLFGRLGRAMYVIPKRAFPDRRGLAFAQDLVSRKLKKFKKLEE